MNILSLWPYLTTDQGVLSSHGFEITGALMIMKCIGWSRKKIKNQTTEVTKVAEHAETKTDNGSMPRMQGKNRSHFQPFPKRKNCQKFNDLCALRARFGQPLAFSRGGPRKREILIPRKEKKTTNRKGPRGRRGDENLIK